MSLLLNSSAAGLESSEAQPDSNALLPTIDPPSHAPTRINASRRVNNGSHSGLASMDSASCITDSCG
jgi:hypothetical protein